jgi:hypothetical protein
MIVREQLDGTLGLISQNDHALVSGMLAAHWGNDRFDRPRPYGSMVRAAAFHDRGWIDYEAKPTVDATGRPPNYRDVPVDEHQLRAFMWTGDWLGKIDPYSGLLAAKHRTGLWQNRYDTIKKPALVNRGMQKQEIHDFIVRSESVQHGIENDLDAKEVRTNYRLLQIWDMISLYLCSTSVLKPMELGPTPVGYGSEAEVYLKLCPQGDGVVTVDPFPFLETIVEVGYVYKTVSAKPFAGGEAFREVYFKAPLKLAQFKLVAE